LIGFDRAKAAPRLLLVGLVCLTGNSLWAAEKEPDDPLVQMVVELVGDADRDMRALGLQHVREEVPGEAATRRFAALLPELPADAQAGLLEALGDRGDVTARPAVLDALKSKDQTVRAAALRALGGLGSAAEVPLLAEKAAAGSDPEKQAARRSLIRLQGDKVNAALVGAMATAAPSVRVELLAALAARNAKEALPTVLQNAKDAEPSVRVAALEALRYLATEDDTAAVVDILKTAADDAERSKAELALLAVCNRGREASAEAIIAGLEDADVPSQIALLHALARAGGADALEAVVGRLDDEDEAVRDEAARMLSRWRDPAAATHLVKIAETGESLRHHVLAIRGLVRLASPREDKPADLTMLAEAMNLAKRPQEKRLALGVLGGIGTSGSLALVAPALDDPALAEEAGLAAVMIAEKMQDGDKDQIRTALEKVNRLVKSEQIRKRAQKVLESL